MENENLTPEQEDNSPKVTDETDAHVKFAVTFDPETNVVRFQAVLAFELEFLPDGTYRYARPYGKEADLIGMAVAKDFFGTAKKKVMEVQKAGLKPLVDLNQLEKARFFTKKTFEQLVSDCYHLHASDYLKPKKAEDI
jgi:hypothetical protein